MSVDRRPAGGPEQPDPSVPAPTWDPQDVPLDVVVAPAAAPDPPPPAELPDDPEVSGP